MHIRADYQIFTLKKKKKQAYKLEVQFDNS